MSKVIVLGGCGAVGSVAARTLAAQEDFDEVLVGDIDETRGRALVESAGLPRLRFRPVDVSTAAGVAEAIRDVDLVVNCVGPFYRTVGTIVPKVIEAGIHYVDVCDDVDVTLELLELSPRAEEAGVTALVGMGSSPGVTNLLALLGSRTFLEETESVDIFHAHGGEPVEGPGVVGHRFHCMSIDIPMYLDGELRHVDYFGEDGIALRQEFDFPVLGDGIPIYPYPHPEQVTLPRYIDLRQVTNKGTVLPNEYYALTRDMCALGLASREPVRVGAHDVVPHDFATAYILKERERILRETNFGEQRGCVTVVVKGRSGGEPREVRFHLASRTQALGEGTGLPVAMGALLLHRGTVTRRGVLPPEACVDPRDFLAIFPEVMELDDDKEGGERFGGVIVEIVDADGRITKLDI